MNAVYHAQLSAKRRGGVMEDYLPIHEFMDSTKELCSDNRHRILHTMWGIKRVIMPIFGHTILNSVGKAINVKDLCEQDHILPDYRNRFIPTLTDFARAIDINAAQHLDFKAFAETYNGNTAVSELMLSPLANTGLRASLLMTHNSWFVNEIFPRIFRHETGFNEPFIQDFAISPADLFNNMDFLLWMDNGSAFPPSCSKTTARIIA
jgi:hypothetical protein